jgi:hypothetical protein
MTRQWRPQPQIAGHAGKGNWAGASPLALAPPTALIYLHLGCCGRMPAESSGRGIAVSQSWGTDARRRQPRRRLGRFLHTQCKQCYRIASENQRGAMAAAKGQTGLGYFVQYFVYGLAGSAQIPQGPTWLNTRLLCASVSPRPALLPHPSQRWWGQAMSPGDAARCKSSWLSGFCCAYACAYAYA